MAAEEALGLELAAVVAVALRAEGRTCLRLRVAPQAVARGEIDVSEATRHHAEPIGRHVAAGDAAAAERVAVAGARAQVRAARAEAVVRCAALSARGQRVAKGHRHLLAREAADRGRRQRKPKVGAKVDDEVVAEGFSRLGERAAADATGGRSASTSSRTRSSRNGSRFQIRRGAAATLYGSSPPPSPPPVRPPDCGRYRWYWEFLRTAARSLCNLVLWRGRFVRAIGGREHERGARHGRRRRHILLVFANKLVGGVGLGPRSIVRAGAKGAQAALQCRLALAQVRGRIQGARVADRDVLPSPLEWPTRWLRAVSAADRGLLGRVENRAHRSERVEHHADALLEGSRADRG